MRRKPPMQGSNGGYNNNQHRRPRYTQVGGGDHRSGGSNHHNRGQRKNYPAIREKYLAQARDALASGDRVLAENFLQHADHCYRMMMEEGIRARENRPVQTTNENQPQPQPAMQEELPVNAGQLPSFITANYGQPQPAQAEPVVVQDWEERDSQ